jgi:hypothetical protein
MDMSANPKAASSSSGSNPKKKTPAKKRATNSSKVKLELEVGRNAAALPDIPTKPSKEEVKSDAARLAVRVALSTLVEAQKSACAYYKASSQTMKYNKAQDDFKRLTSFLDNVLLDTFHAPPGYCRAVPHKLECDGEPQDDVVEYRAYCNTCMCYVNLKGDRYNQLGRLVSSGSANEHASTLPDGRRVFYCRVSPEVGSGPCFCPLCKPVWQMMLDYSPDESNNQHQDLREAQEEGLKEMKDAHFAEPKAPAEEKKKKTEPVLSPVLAPIVPAPKPPTTAAAMPKKPTVEIPVPAPAVPAPGQGSVVAPKTPPKPEIPVSAKAASKEKENPSVAQTPPPPKPAPAPAPTAPAQAGPDTKQEMPELEVEAEVEFTEEPTAGAAIASSPSLSPLLHPNPSGENGVTDDGDGQNEVRVPETQEDDETSSEGEDNQPAKRRKLEGKTAKVEETAESWSRSFLETSSVSLKRKEAHKQEA